MRKPSILIVEDNLIIAMDIRERLEIMGYPVKDIVTSGEKALARTKETQPDLVLMDISLRGSMNGIETANIISSKFKTKIIFLTGNSELLKKANAAYPYINKPFDDNELLQKITNVYSD